MIVYKLSWVPWVLIALLPTWVVAQESDRHHQAVLDQHANGSVNWTDGAIVARGFGVSPPDARAAVAGIMAEQAARAVAFRNLLELIQGIQVDAETIVDKLILKKDEINARVRGVIKNAKVVERQVHSDGSVELKVSMRLWGKESLTSSLLEEKMFSKSSMSAETARGQYTGVVFDARGLGVNPVLFPTVLDEKKKLVYGPDMVSRMSAKKYGLAQYTLDESSPLVRRMGNTFGVAEKKAVSSSRVGSRPLRIKGLEKLGTFKANMMISQADAQKIRQDPSILRALHGAKVIIITDPLVAGVEGRLNDPREILVVDSPISNQPVPLTYSMNRMWGGHFRSCAFFTSARHALPICCDSRVYREPSVSDLRFLYGCQVSG